MRYETYYVIKVYNSFVTCHGDVHPSLGYAETYADPDPDLELEPDERWVGIDETDDGYEEFEID